MPIDPATSGQTGTPPGWPPWTRAATPRHASARIAHRVEPATLEWVSQAATSTGARFLDGIALATAVVADRFGLAGGVVVHDASWRKVALDVTRTWSELVASAAEWAAADDDASCVVGPTGRPGDAFWCVVGIAQPSAGAALTIDAPGTLRVDVVDSLAAHVVAALDAWKATPDARIDACDLLTGRDFAEIARYNRASGDAAHEYGERIDEAVLHWAARKAESVAVEGGGRRLTYAELASQSAAVANALSARGVGPQTIVASAFPRTVAMVPALLGTLRAGAAYVALDLDWPRARLADALSIAGVRHAVVADGVSLPGDVRTLRLDDCSGSWSSSAGHHGGDAACVYFTSGSTGRPKGVVAPHRSLTRLVCSDWPGVFDECTVVLAAAALPWDVFAFELWGALANGGRLLLHEPRHLTPGSLRDAVAHGADTMFVTTSLFNVIVDEDVNAFAGARTVLIGGERLSSRHVARFLKMQPETRLINGYGPVESNFATMHDIRPADVREPSGIPLGRPVSRTEVLCAREGADGVLVPVATGAPGELVVGGEGVADGYLGGADSDWRFVEGAIRGRPGRRWYRTGDVGVLFEGGQLAFVGRADRQLKVRGVRVEPGDVESVLERHPAIARAVVLPIDGEEGAALGLVAYCAARSHAELDVEELRAHAAGLLPSALVPDRIVPVDAMPLLANGKVDARALPSVDPTQQRVPADNGQAADSLQRLVLDTVAGVVGGASVRLDSTLVELGADSLAAVRIASRLEQATGSRLEVADILAGETPRAIADALGRAPDAVPLTHAVDDSAIPVSPPQRRFWLLDQLSPADPRHVMQIVYALDGPVDPDALRAAWRDVTARHDALRTTLDVATDGLVQQCLPEGTVTVHVTPLGDASLDEQAQELARHEQRGFDIAHDPPARLLAAVGPRTAVLVVTVHHSACDGWSERVLIADLAAAYDARARGRPARWGQPAVSYRDYAAVTARPLDPDVREANIAYWARRLEGVRSLDWPARNGAAVQMPVGIGTLPVELPARLVEPARRVRVTAYAWLLAAFAGAVREATGQRAFAVGVPSASRTEPMFQNTIGLFVNPMAVALRTDEGDGPDALLEWARRSIIDALRHDKVPFEELVSALGRPRDGVHPFCQTRLAVHPIPQWRSRLVAGRRALVPPCEDPLDLAMDLWELGDGSVRGFVTFETSRVAEPDATRVVAMMRAGLEEMAELAAHRPSLLPR